MFDKLSIRQKYSIVAVLMLIVLTLGIYWPVQNYEFIRYDDNVYVTINKYVRSGITLDGICWAFSTTYAEFWHPLTWLSLMLDYQLFGMNAGGYHWTNVIIHIFNTILLFLLFRNLTGAIWRSAFVAALFAVHPINVESVAWVAERKNVLSTFFWLLTMLFYVRYVKQPHWKRYWPVFVSFALGLMSKPMLITLPFVLLLMDYWPLNRISINTQNETDARLTVKAEKEKLSFLILEKIPLFVLSAIFICITAYASQSEKALSFTLKQRINNIIFSYAMYVKKLFWPADLSIHYMYLGVPMWQIFLSAAFLIMMTIFVCKYFRKYPYLPVGWFWYLGTMVPVIGIVQISQHTMADRYAYVPFIGLFVMIAWGAEQVSSKAVYLKKILILASILIIVLLITATHNQIKLWPNTVTLFEDALKKDPHNYIANLVIAYELALHGENEKALYYDDMALRADPQSSVAYNHKGFVFMKMGNRDEALKNFEKALQLDQLSVDANSGLGVIYLKDNNPEKAMEYFEKVIEINPDHTEAHNYLGIALVKKGRIQEGILQFEKALKINPNYQEANRNLQTALKLKK
jgi:tetratricopeptide (TPR) repeat protein